MEKIQKYSVIVAILFANIIGIVYVITITKNASASTENYLTVCQDSLPTCEYSTIQDAIDSANENDVIKIATGTYTESRMVGDLRQVAYISKSLSIIGGYTNSFTEPSNPDNNLTILDGEDMGRVIYVTGNITVTITGLHIQRGNSSDLGNGAGLYANSANVIISDNEVYNNLSYPNFGGGVYLENSQFILQENRIDNNEAGSNGGGFYLSNSKGTAISNTVINNNGGGVSIYGGSVTVTRNIIQSNRSSYGAGLETMFDSETIINNNVISGNVAAYQGGGLDLSGTGSNIVISNTLVSNIADGCAGFDLSGRTVTTFTNNVVTNNNAIDYDGGGGCLGENSLVSQNLISRNTAQRFGGGIHDGGSGSAVIEKNLILQNSASCGGGISFYNGTKTLNNNFIANNLADSGSGLCIQGGTQSIQHNTFVNNSNGAGIYVTKSFGSSGTDGVAYITNTMIISHSIGVYASTYGTISMDGTLWGKGEWDNGVDWLGNGLIVTGTVNIWGDPDFVDISNSDFHIGLNSSALNAGILTNIVSDIDLDARPNGKGYDIGADEFIESKYLYLPLVLKN